MSAKTTDGTTALMFAEQEDHTELVELLKKAGAEESDLLSEPAPMPEVGKVNWGMKERWKARFWNALERIHRWAALLTPEGRDFSVTFVKWREPMTRLPTNWSLCFNLTESTSMSIYMALNVAGLYYH